MGSARSHGKTRAACDFLVGQFQWSFFDLLDYQIGHYDYQHRNQDDDFLPLVRKLIATSDHWVFATPIYWYAMSGHLKVFLDRLTDLMDLYPDLLEALKGKQLSLVISCSIEELPEGFLVPFRDTAEYLGMEWKGHVHTWLEEEALPPEIQSQLQAFGAART